MKRFASLIALFGVFLTLSLTGCGQKGDLYLPQADEPSLNSETADEDDESTS